MRAILLLSLLAGTLLAIGCSSKNGNEKRAQIDSRELTNYRSASNQQANPLLRAPRVVSDSPGDLLLVAGAGSGILPEITNARIVRQGAAAWLEVDLPIDKVWPIVRRFWLNEGFGIEVEIPEAGIMETDWQQDRAKILGTGLTRWLDIALERLHDTGERHRFRTRIERSGADESLIFIAFRGVYEKSGNQFERQPHDPTLETEMLSRLMLSFSADDELIASVKDPELRAQAKQALYEIREDQLIIKLGFEEAWRRLTIAIDRAGFTVAAIDRQAGSIELLYAEPKLEDENRSLLDWLSGSKAEAAAPFPVNLQFACQETSCTVNFPQQSKYNAAIMQILAEHI